MAKRGRYRTTLEKMGRHLREVSVVLDIRWAAKCSRSELHMIEYELLSSPRSWSAYCSQNNRQSGREEYMHGRSTKSHIGAPEIQHMDKHARIHTVVTETEIFVQGL